MNKKSAILLFSVLFLVGVFVYANDLVGWDFSGVSHAIAGESSLYTTASANWIKGGLNDTINFTITAPANISANLSAVTIEFGEAIAVLHNWENNTALHAVAAVYDNASTPLYVEEWVCNDTGLDALDYSYTSAATQFDNWTCANSSTAPSQLAPQYKLIVAINVSANSTSDEDYLGNYTFIVREGMDKDSYTDVYNDQFYIDDQYPRLIEVNISDGNTTYHNSTWYGGGYFLNGPITIESLIEDSQLGGVIVLGYNCNATNGSFAQDSLNNGGWYQEPVLTVSNQEVGTTINQKGNVTSSSINCYTLYNTNDPIEGANETFTFAFLVNDTFNHRIMLNGTGDQPEIPFNITLDDGDRLPTIERVNVTQTTAGSSDGVISISKTLDDHTSGNLYGGDDYLRASVVTFEVEVKGGYKPENVFIVWNDTGAATTTFAPAVIGDTGAVFPYITNLVETASLNLTNRSAGAWDTGYDQAALNGTIVYYQTLDLSGNNSHDFAFWVYANNTGDNYTRIAGPYRFVLDGGAPSITMTPPTDLVINPRGSITYSCKATETESGAYQIMWKLKKPSETEYTKKQDYESLTSETDSITFTGDDTNLAGEYYVQCLAIDKVGNEDTYTSSSTETFSVHYTTVEGGAGEAGGAAADIDLSTTEEITITEKQGVISTFTLDGTTVHTIKIKTVDEIAGTVTIVIESDPIEITLKIGETKEVDIDADGANDISVTLNKIIDGAADLTTKRLTPLPEKEVPTEEVPPTEKPTEEIVSEEAASKTWLWILIIVIIVVIGVGYWFMKRK